jgi:hypothetical protein
MWQKMSKSDILASLLGKIFQTQKDKLLRLQNIDVQQGQ